MKQSDLKNLVNRGVAKLLDSENNIPESFSLIDVTFGVNGANGALIQDTETGELWAVIGRTTILFIVM